MTTAPRAPTRAARAAETPPIDEGTAWSLVRAVRPGADAPAKVHDSRLAAWLQVYPSGAWDTSSSLTEDARQLVDLYLPLQLQADLVIAQAGQSLDGRIATASGHSHYVTGPADIRRLHRLRALVDAVVVGAATIDADNPRLTVREVDGDNPVRVVIDPNDRLDRSRHVFCDGAAPTIVIRRGRGGGSVAPGGAAHGGGTGGAAGSGNTSRTSAAAGSGGTGGDAGRTDRTPRAATLIELSGGPSGEIDPHDVIAALRALGYRRLLIEGGGITVSRFLDADAVDRLQVAVAPLLIGSGRPAFTLAPIATLDEAIRPACRVFRLNDDVLFDLDLRADTATRTFPKAR